MRNGKPPPTTPHPNNVITPRTFCSIRFHLQIYFSISCITMSLFLHEERRYLRGEVDKPIGESFLERDTISGGAYAKLCFFCCALFFLSLVIFCSTVNENRFYAA